MTMMTVPAPLSPVPPSYPVPHAVTHQQLLDILHTF